MCVRVKMTTRLVVWIFFLPGWVNAKEDLCSLSVCVCVRVRVCVRRCVYVCVCMYSRMPWETRVCPFLCQCLCLVHTRSCTYVCMPVCVFDTGVSLRKSSPVCACISVSLLCLAVSGCLCVCVSLSPARPRYVYSVWLCVCDKERPWLCVCYYVMLGCLCLCLCHGLAMSCLCSCPCYSTVSVSESVSVSVCVLAFVRSSFCAGLAMAVCHSASVSGNVWRCVSVPLDGLHYICIHTLCEEVCVQTLIIRSFFRIEFERGLSHVETKQTAPDRRTTWQRHASALCALVFVFVVWRTTERAHGEGKKNGALEHSWSVFLEKLKFKNSPKKNPISAYQRFARAARPSYSTKWRTCLYTHIHLLCTDACTYVYSHAHMYVPTRVNICIRIHTYEWSV